MMQQYLEVKKELPPNTLLFFRLGDFYEMFYDDAEVAANLLKITLTQRQGYPMAGVPYHAANGYIRRALAAGKKVAICEQVETPKPGQLVKRRLMRILTPGTILEDNQIESHQNHFILALAFVKKNLTAAWLELSTGEFQIAFDPNPGNLLPVFTAIEPREIIMPENEHKRWTDNKVLGEWHEPFERLLHNRSLSELPSFRFDPVSGAQTTMETLGVLNLEGFGINKNNPALGTAGAIIAYATESLCARPENLNHICEYKSQNKLLPDPTTLSNLEIFQSSNNTREGSLLSTMDATMTAPGARKLEHFLTEPSLDIKEIQRRQNCVHDYFQAPTLAVQLQDLLKGVRDIPRILGRLQNRIHNPRELGGIRDTLALLPKILQNLTQFKGIHATTLRQRIKDFPELSERLQKSLQDELPNQLKDGGYIRDGYDEELDGYRSLAQNSKNWLTELEVTEQKRTGIKNMRIKFNNAFGYFIEVTKANLHLVPDDYIRKQTTTNAERFYTPALKEKEHEILNAHENAVAREEVLFRELTAFIFLASDDLAITAAALAEVDVFLGWAKIARIWDYCCPKVDNSDLIEINQGRHPVVEQMMRRERHGLAGTQNFVPNDTFLSATGEQLALLTGPNMAGKSTFIRQVALITFMAQVGSWVPAKSCHIGLVDRIFSRVGASDELARGNSTFMVEMNETANIINNSTAKSLIILDEIGRGTSTYDGLSIAWAVVEHLHGKKDSGPRTLFATHYHELTQLEKQLERLCNYCVVVKEWDEDIIFLREVVRGAADRSYGIQVARLAGLPRSIIDRATILLEKLESDTSSHNLIRRQKRSRTLSSSTENEDTGSKQLSLF